jgi:hypothetical protein
MYIDSLTIAAIFVFAFALAMFVKHCLVNSCILSSDRKVTNETATHAGGRK